MHIPERNKHIVKSSVLKEIDQLVNDSLHSEWAIYIEYARKDVETYMNWCRWGKVHYAVKDAKNIIDAIGACYASYPDYLIRLYAEKFRPNTHLIYWIQTSDKVSSDVRSHSKLKNLSPEVSRALLRQ